MTQTPTRFVVNLAQDDVRGVGQAQNFAIAIEVYDNKGQRVTRRQCGNLVCITPVFHV